MVDFVKMHGLGNDFLLVDTTRIKASNRPNWASVSRKYCDRNFGVGADGLILVEESENADVRFRIINSDGSEAEMCGNGIRCFARYVYESGLVSKEVIQVETLAGIIVPKLLFHEGKVVKVQVDMGAPILDRKDIPMAGGGSGPVLEEQLIVDGEPHLVTVLSMGNPHCLVFVEDIGKAPVSTLGPQIEVHQAFPRKTNVEFIQVLDEHNIEMRVWERGVGPTLACGTGACAAAVGSALTKRTGRYVNVRLAGGSLEIQWSEETNRVLMTGPAEYICQGRFCT